MMNEMIYRNILLEEQTKAVYKALEKCEILFRRSETVTQINQVMFEVDKGEEDEEEKMY